MTSDSNPPTRGQGLGGANNAYVELLRDSRGLRREQREARDAWFSKLAEKQKDEILFELEILLKGLACFANPRNHPGSGRRQTIVSHDFREQLAHAKDGMARVVQLARMMLGERDRAFVFQRYLETVLPEDNSRTRLVYATMAQESPEAALFLLRQAFTNLIETGTAMLRLPRVSYRVFYAHLSITMREITQSAFFNPLSALEFRPEFDRIGSSAVLELMQNVSGEHPHRLVALTFLSLYRMLRYLRLLDAIALDHTDRRVAGRAYLVLAVLRSDGRALSNYLRRRSGELLAEGFSRELGRVGAADIAARHGALVAEGQRLSAIKDALLTVSASLRIELRRIFEHELPPADAKLTEQDLRARIQGATALLRPAIELCVLFLGRALGATLEEGRVFEDVGVRRGTIARVRQNVWMFAQITRAFTSKLRHADPTSDLWAVPESFGFVRDFLGYFRAMGYPLVVLGDYPRAKDLVASLAALRDADLLDPTRLDTAARECEAFYDFSIQLFERMSQRELAGVPFDRPSAARSLRLYLGD
ncbi:hypothetical protein [Polyangium jinanense]|uniref:Uncharacterized protein n=1 Tax=Polyangium jinanense TaxID=2829994 RepID=A0A9X4ANU8_9BACT|nr:hypothetical protein [Polyangium jinanense]MDC3953525.1 hypothetical protein [Polyangium jinanense]MDC3979354.1 hypothetical protein [Polyangium jinanense]